MPKTGDNIYKRKDGRWEGRFVKERRNGRTVFGSVFGKTRREAKPEFYSYLFPPSLIRSEKTRV